MAVDGDIVVATGRSRCRELPGGPVVRIYECFVRRFDGEGCCREFTEYISPPMNGAGIERSAQHGE